MMKFCYWLQVVNNFAVNKFQGQGSGCGSVGRVVASKARGTQFESSNREIFTINIFTVSCKKTKIKEKETENGNFLKPNLKGNQSNSLLRIYILQIALSNFVVFLYLLF